MAQPSREIIAITRRYLNAVERAGVRIAQAYLYGSRATGKARPDSDIDIAVVSPDLSNSSFENRMRLFDFRRDIDLRIEPVGFRPEKFAAWHPFVQEISRTGVRLK